MLLPLLFLSLAGCIGAAPDDPPTEPEPFHLSVPPGRWVLVDRVDPQEVASIHGGWEADNVQGTWTEDSVGCAFGALADGWLDGWPKEFSPVYRGAFTGTRTGVGTSWASYTLSTSVGTGGGGFIMLGSESPPALFFHDAVGPAVHSTFNLTSDDAWRVLDSGRAWCLDGPSRFQEGMYRVENLDLDATGLAWSESFENGVLVRFEAIDATGVRMVGPSGTHERPASLTDDADVTFCLAEPGSWRLEVDAVSTQGAWRLHAEVLDYAAPDCTGWKADWESPSLRTDL